MKFSDIDKRARSTMSPEMIAVQDRHRAELAAQLRVGIALRDARETLGMTQTELAAKLGLAQSALSRIEAGRTNISLAMLRRIGEGLGSDLVLQVGASRATVITAA